MLDNILDRCGAKITQLDLLLTEEMADLSRVFATITTLNLRFAEKIKGAYIVLKTLFERNDPTGLHHLSLSHDSAVTA